VQRLLSGDDGVVAHLLAHVGVLDPA
jgi:hypothetical protein